ncbi:MAG TPA: hypothetical protein VM536_07325 [Chloroflexia bacterium]|nr:hypothetical protein [Chloroflexia bacterium]
MSEAPAGTVRVFALPAWRLRMILAVYSYQGLVAGFGLTALPNHLAATGASAGAIGPERWQGIELLRRLARQLSGDVERLRIFSF